MIRKILDIILRFHNEIKRRRELKKRLEELRKLDLIPLFTNKNSPVVQVIHHRYISGAINHDAAVAMKERYYLLLIPSDIQKRKMIQIYIMH